MRLQSRPPESLIVTAFYLYRRRRGALHAAIALLLALGALNLLKGLDFEEAALELRCRRAALVGPRRVSCASRSGQLAVGALARSRRDRGRRRRLLVTSVWIAAPASAEFRDHLRASGDLRPLAAGPVLASTTRLGRLPLAVALLAVTALVAIAYLIFRPLAAPRSLPDATARAAAVDLVRAHGTRHARVLQAPPRQAATSSAPTGARSSATGSRTACCSSPAIPVGPARGARRRLLRELCGFAERRGLKLAALGASGELVPLCGAGGPAVVLHRRRGDRRHVDVLARGPGDPQGAPVGQPARARPATAPSCRSVGDARRARRSPSSSRFGALARRGSGARLLDGDGLARATHEGGDSVVVVARDDARRDPRLPALRAQLRPRGDVALAHAPRPRHAERADRVPRRPRDRAAARARRRGAVAQLRRLRAPDAQPGGPARARARRASSRSRTRSSRSRASTASTRSSSRAGSRATCSTRARSACPRAASPRCGQRASCPSRAAAASVTPRPHDDQRFAS